MCTRVLSKINVYCFNTVDGLSPRAQSPTSDYKEKGVAKEIKFAMGRSWIYNQSWEDPAVDIPKFKLGKGEDFGLPMQNAVISIFDVFENSQQRNDN